MTERRAVVLTDRQKPNVPLVGKVLSQFWEVPLTDAVQMAKHRWGLIEENLDHEQAADLVGRLEKEGMKATSIPSASLATGRIPHAVVSANPLSQGLELHVKEKYKKTVPWSAVLLLGVAVFKKSVTQTIKSEEGPSAGERLAKAGILLATGILLPLSKRRRIEKKLEETEVQYVMDIFLKDPPLRIRLNAKTMDFKFLKERMQASSPLNFKMFLTELSKMIPAVMRNTGAEGLIAGRSVTEMGYETEKDFDQECRWLLTLTGIIGSR